MAVTAHLDRLTTQDTGTIGTTHFIRIDFTRIADNSKDYFIGEYDKDLDGPTLETAIEGDVGEDFE